MYDVQPQCLLAWGDTEENNRDRCSYSFIISSVCGTPRRLAVAERRSALINIPLCPTEPVTSPLPKYACKLSPPTQSALQQPWEEVWKMPQVSDIQQLLWLKKRPFLTNVRVQKGTFNLKVSFGSRGCDRPTITGVWRRSKHMRLSKTTAGLTSSRGVAYLSSTSAPSAVLTV